jgi:hypothetical protein
MDFFLISLGECCQHEFKQMLDLFFRGMLALPT